MDKGSGPNGVPDGTELPAEPPDRPEGLSANRTEPGAPEIRAVAPKPETSVQGSERRSELGPLRADIRRFIGEVMDDTRGRRSGECGLVK
jgi:hypothetical protein